MAKKKPAAKPKKKPAAKVENNKDTGNQKQAWERDEMIECAEDESEYEGNEYDDAVESGEED